MARPHVFIFTAIHLEAKAVAKALRLEYPGPGQPTGGIVGALQVSLHLIGIGGRALARIRPRARPDAVVMAGLAGALDPSLKIGEIVIDAPEHVLCGSTCGRRGTIVTADEIVATPARKSELFQSTGALAVDMEGSRARRWADLQIAPFISLRSISDRAGDGIDAAVPRVVDGWGRLKLSSLLSALLCRPTLLWHLARLGIDSNRAARQLGPAVRALLVHMEECESRISH